MSADTNYNAFGEFVLNESQQEEFFQRGAVTVDAPLVITEQEEEEVKNMGMLSADETGDAVKEYGAVASVKDRDTIGTNLEESGGGDSLVIRPSSPTDFLAGAALGTDQKDYNDQLLVDRDVDLATVAFRMVEKAHGDFVRLATNRSDLFDNIAKIIGKYFLAMTARGKKLLLSRLLGGCQGDEVKIADDKLDLAALERAMVSRTIMQNDYVFNCLGRPADWEFVNSVNGDFSSFAKLGPAKEVLPRLSQEKHAEDCATARQQGKKAPRARHYKTNRSVRGITLRFVLATICFVFAFGVKWESIGASAALTVAAYKVERVNAGKDKDEEVEQNKPTQWNNTICADCPLVDSGPKSPPPSIQEYTARVKLCLGHSHLEQKSFGQRTLPMHVCLHWYQVLATRAAEKDLKAPPAVGQTSQDHLPVALPESGIPYDDVSAVDDTGFPSPSNVTVLPTAANAPSPPASPVCANGVPTGRDFGNELDDPVFPVLPIDANAPSPPASPSGANGCLPPVPAGHDFGNELHDDSVFAVDERAVGSVLDNESDGQALAVGEGPQLGGEDGNSHPIFQVNGNSNGIRQLRPRKRSAIEAIAESSYAGRSGTRGSPIRRSSRGLNAASRDSASSTPAPGISDEDDEDPTAAVASSTCHYPLYGVTVEEGAPFPSEDKFLSIEEYCHPNIDELYEAEFRALYTAGEGFNFLDAEDKSKLTNLETRKWYSTDEKTVAAVYHYQNVFSEYRIKKIFEDVNRQCTFLGNSHKIGNKVRRWYSCSSPGNRGGIFKLDNDRKVLACRPMARVEHWISGVVEQLMAAQDKVVAQKAAELGKEFHLRWVKNKAMCQLTAGNFLDSIYKLHADSSYHHNHKKMSYADLSNPNCREELLRLPPNMLMRVVTVVLSTADLEECQEKGTSEVCFQVQSESKLEGTTKHITTGRSSIHIQSFTVQELLKHAVKDVSSALSSSCDDRHARLVFSFRYSLDFQDDLDLLTKLVKSSETVSFRNIYNDYSVGKMYSGLTVKGKTPVPVAPLWLRSPLHGPGVIDGNAIITTHDAYDSDDDDNDSSPTKIWDNRMHVGKSALTSDVIPNGVTGDEEIIAKELANVADDSMEVWERITSAPVASRLSKLGIEIELQYGRHSAVYGAPPMMNVLRNLGSDDKPIYDPMDGTYRRIREGDVIQDSEVRQYLKLGGRTKDRHKAWRGQHTALLNGFIPAWDYKNDYRGMEELQKGMRGREHKDFDRRALDKIMFWLGGSGGAGQFLGAVAEDLHKAHMNNRKSRLTLPGTQRGRSKQNAALREAFERDAAIAVFRRPLGIEDSDKDGYLQFLGFFRICRHFGMEEDLDFVQDHMAGIESGFQSKHKYNARFMLGKHVKCYMRRAYWTEDLKSDEECSCVIERNASSGQDIDLMYPGGVRRLRLDITDPEMKVQMKVPFPEGYYRDPTADDDDSAPQESQSVGDSAPVNDTTGENDAGCGEDPTAEGPLVRPPKRRRLAQQPQPMKTGEGESAKWERVTESNSMQPLSIMLRDENIADAFQQSVLGDIEDLDAHGEVKDDSWMKPVFFSFEINNLFEVLQRQFVGAGYRYNRVNIRPPPNEETGDCAYYLEQEVGGKLHKYLKELGTVVQSTPYPVPIRTMDTTTLELLLMARSTFKECDPKLLPKELQGRRLLFRPRLATMDGSKLRRFVLSSAILRVTGRVMHLRDYFRHLEGDAYKPNTTRLFDVSDIELLPVFMALANGGDEHFEKSSGLKGFHSKQFWSHIPNTCKKSPAHLHSFLVQFNDSLDCNFFRMVKDLSKDVEVSREQAVDALVEAIKQGTGSMKEKKEHVLFVASQIVADIEEVFCGAKQHQSPFTGNYVAPGSGGVGGLRAYRTREEVKDDRMRQSERKMRRQTKRKDRDNARMAADANDSGYDGSSDDDETLVVNQSIFRMKLPPSRAPVVADEVLDHIRSNLSWAELMRLGLERVSVDDKTIAVVVSLTGREIGPVEPEHMMCKGYLAGQRYRGNRSRAGVPISARSHLHPLRDENFFSGCPEIGDAFQRAIDCFEAAIDNRDDADLRIGSLSAPFIN